MSKWLQLIRATWNLVLKHIFKYNIIQAFTCEKLWFMFIKAHNRWLAINPCLAFQVISLFLRIQMLCQIFLQEIGRKTLMVTFVIEKKEQHEKIQTLLEGFNVVPLLCNEYWKQEASYSLVLRRVTPEEDVKFRFCGVK